MKSHQFTAVIEREDDGFVSLCPELDVASQGGTVEEAKANLVEAVELFLETASESEIESRLHAEVFVTRMEVPVPNHSGLRTGTLQAIIRQSELPRSLFES